MIACCPRPAKPHKGKSMTEEQIVFKQACLGGGNLHSWLKWWSYGWLLAEYGETPIFEYTMRSYGRADIFCPVNKIIVECGDTASAKVNVSLSGDLAESFVIVPYQSSIVENYAMANPCRTLVAFIFSKNNNI